MKTNETPAEAAAGAGSPAASYEEKLAEIESCHTALDARRIALFREEVFPTFMRKHYGRVQRRIRKWDVPENQVEEVLQEAFVSLFNHVVAHGAQHGLCRNLSVILKGKLLHHARDQKHASDTEPLPSSGSTPPETPPDLERAIDYRKAARRFLLQLSDDHRAVVERCILQDKTQAAAAAELDLPEKTVGSRLAAAMRVLFTLATTWFPESEQEVA